MDNPEIAQAAQMTTLRDNWLIEIGRHTLQVKACLKKAAEAEKKEKARQEKAYEKAREKSQLQDIRRIALANCQAKVGAFRASYLILIHHQVVILQNLQTFPTHLLLNQQRQKSRY